MNHGPTTETPPSQPLDWRPAGTCRQVDPELFFHPEGERGNAREERDDQAKAVCRRCPVMDECRAWSLETRQEYGVWGGLSETDRDDVLQGTDRRARRAGHTRRNNAPAGRFDIAVIADAISALLAGDPEALRMQLNREERWQATTTLCATREPARVADLMHVDVNTVYAYLTRHRNRVADLVSA